MTEPLELLKQLQAVDGELFRLRRSQAAKPRELAELAAVLAAEEAKLKAAEEKLKLLQLAQKEKEIDLQTREASVRKLQGQLFQLKTNKEYSTMQREIEALKADNSLLEEGILGLFEAIEKAQQEKQAEAARLAQERQRLEAKRHRIEEALAELETAIAKLERQRQGLTPAVPAATLRAYERVLAIREGLALVPVMKSSCGGCNRRLPPQVINEVYLKAKLVSCESCSRILYFDEAHSVL
jgi:predicted  nucleic acid-binding Zn-ribbon protein